MVGASYLKERLIIHETASVVLEETKPHIYFGLFHTKQNINLSFGASGRILYVKLKTRQDDIFLF